MVDSAKVDRLEVYGESPADPVAIFGWGTIPDQYGCITDGRDDESVTEPELPSSFLHDEIVRIIEIDGGEPMSSADVAGTINEEGRYRKKDGSPMTSSKISACASKYPTWFERTDDGRVALRRRTV